MVRQDKTKSGRVTPKGTVPASSSPVGASSTNRQQPVKLNEPSPMVVPIVMFGSLVLGTGVLLFNYLTEDVLGTPNNLYLGGGLVLILVGIIAATQYR